MCVKYIFKWRASTNAENATSCYLQYIFCITFRGQVDGKKTLTMLGNPSAPDDKESKTNYKTNEVSRDVRTYTFFFRRHCFIGLAII